MPETPFDRAIGPLDEALRDAGTDPDKVLAVVLDRIGTFSFRRAGAGQLVVTHQNPEFILSLKDAAGVGTVSITNPPKGTTPRSIWSVTNRVAILSIALRVLPYLTSPARRALFETAIAKARATRAYESARTLALRKQSLFAPDDATIMGDALRAVRELPFQLPKLAPYLEDDGTYQGRTTPRPPAHVRVLDMLKDDDPIPSTPDVDPSTAAS